MRARGIRVQQLYATADLGLIAYESALPDGTVTEGMILDESLILEIVRPGTGDSVSAGEVAEVVVTSLNKDYPLIRFATGDLSAVLAGTSPCGRTNTRIKGWMGRADQTTKVRAMFVTPKQIGEVLRRHPEVLKARLFVAGETGNDRMTLKCEALGDFQHDHATRTVVVGAVHYGIAPRRPDAPGMRDQTVDPPLLVSGRYARRIVRALPARHGIHRSQGVMVNRGGRDSVVIVMRAHQDVFAGARRIGPRQDGDHIPRRHRSLAPCIVPVPREWSTLSANGQLASWTPEQTLRHRIGNDGRWWVNAFAGHRRRFNAHARGERRANRCR
jgi:hypothetical protein